MQVQLNSLKSFTTKKLLKIKEQKTNVMKFSVAKNHDFPPELSVNGFSRNIKVVTETKLLGIMITNDLKWASNTEYICKKSYAKMWTLRRMKLLEVDPAIICDVYVKEIRSLLELAVPAWHSGLTKKQSADIERIQKVAVRVILSDRNGKCFLSYNMAMAALELEPLHCRREKLCLKFSKKSLKSKHKDMFPVNRSQYHTRDRSKYKEAKCNTKRYFNSPINYLTRQLNNC